MEIVLQICALDLSFPFAPYKGSRISGQSSEEQGLNFLCEIYTPWFKFFNCTFLNFLISSSSKKIL